jgi:hypothetical protein
MLQTVGAAGRDRSAGGLGAVHLRQFVADYIGDAASWDSNPDNTGPPELDGQLFHFFDSPNRFDLRPFYTLHVWAWKDNPTGAFTNWNPNLTCEPFLACALSV